jgi:hypothetical protein
LHIGRAWVDKAVTRTELDVLRHSFAEAFLSLIGRYSDEEIRMVLKKLAAGYRV